ncbi:pectate lyase [Dactylosporangium maewongense]|uniref:Pectate lyase n=1 Tax=Dactylosporangium maewongense TaxID=634393 RepID=A0ABP4LRA0_9ACTN
MRKTTVVAAAVASAALLAGAAVSAPIAFAGAGTPPAALALARQALPAGDGWASDTTGTTGGALADADHVFTVRTRDELAAAVAGDTPKIVFVSGGIDANAGHTCADYADPAYSLDAFLAAYDPAVWGRATKPTGPLEDARARSAKNQGARVNIKVGGNTTIVGLGGSKITGANLLVEKVDNVILRNLRLEDAHDCFPSWDPTDGALGNWNSLYDTVTVTGSTHVWADHNNFSDGNNTDETQPLYFGRPYQVHDGALDVIRASDLVTISWNNFFDHDKTMLIGSSNTVGADVGKLRVTIHHNRFANVGQRVPRVRFGQVDVYSNYFYATDEDSYSYSWGVGVYASLYAENNFLLRSADIPLSSVVYDWRGTAPGTITEVGTATRIGTGPVSAVSLVDEYNAGHDPDLTAGTWVPTLRAAAPDPATAVPALVSAKAGAGKLGF